jgi:hypothetical protein
MTMAQGHMDKVMEQVLGKEVVMVVTKCKAVTNREAMDTQDKPLQDSTELSQATLTDLIAITTMVLGEAMEVTNSQVCL